MKVFVILAGLLVAFPAAAQEQTPLGKLLDGLPPMSAQDRAEFDKAARSMYRQSCDCLVFLSRGELRKFDLPMDDNKRRILIEGLMRKLFIPLDSNTERPT